MGKIPEHATAADFAAAANSAAVDFVAVDFSEMPLIVYFSSVSENTHRFVEKLGMRAQRIPLIDHDARFVVDEPYILISPTYGGGKASDGADVGQPGRNSGFVPKQVIKFLNNRHNRLLIRGVIAAGNTNFGEEFCFAGDIISNKCQVPYLYRFELMGDADDVDRVRTGLHEFAQSQEFSQCRQPQPQ